MKRGIPAQPEGCGVSAQQWQSMSDEERDAIIGGLTQASGTAAVAPNPTKRRRGVLASDSEDEDDAPTQTPPKAVPRQQAEESGPEDAGDIEDAVLADLDLTLALEAGDAYIIGHGETVGTVALPVAAPKQTFCFYADPGLDLNFIDALRVLSGKNKTTTYTVRAGTDQTLPKLALTPLTEQEAEWVRWSLTAADSVAKRKVYFVGKPPLDGARLTLYDALALVKYEHVHVIACQGAQGAASNAVKSPQARAVERQGLKIIDDAARLEPEQTLAIIDGRELPERAELLSVPFFEFFVDNLKNPLKPTLGKDRALDFKAVFDGFAQDSTDPDFVARLLWKALPEASRRALLHWDKSSWKKLDQDEEEDEDAS